MQADLATLKESTNSAHRTDTVGILPRIFHLGLWITVIVLLSGAIAIISWSYAAVQVQHAVQDVESIGATCRWSFENDQAQSSTVDRIREQVANRWGPQFAGVPEEVVIDNRFATDAELHSLASLRGLRRIVIHSDAATDRTLGVIAELPKLEELYLSGEKFTLEGLLALRDSETLEIINYEPKAFTPAELALLAAELPKSQATGTASQLPPAKSPGRGANKSGQVQARSASLSLLPIDS